MLRQKYQRPDVYPTGKREYYVDTADKQQSRHKSKTWSRATYTKGQAQAEPIFPSPTGKVLFSKCTGSGCKSAVSVPWKRWTGA